MVAHRCRAQCCRCSRERWEAPSVARVAHGGAEAAVSILVIDVGTSGLRAAIVRPDATVDHVCYRPFPPDTPFPGLVEFDAAAMASAVLDTADAALAAGGPVEAVGITNQRASTVVWDRATGVPVAPGLGWQDLRTVGTCLELSAEGSALRPQPVGDEARRSARRPRSRPGSRPLLRHHRHMDRLDAVRRCAPRDRSQQRRCHRAPPPGRLAVGDAGAGGAAHPRADAPRARRHRGRRR